jgi:hypothetical protein
MGYVIQPIKETIMFIKFITWLRSFFPRRQTATLATHYETASTPLPYEPEPFRATKAYADQRQKAPHNRRRKPGKAMANLYQLKG